MNGLFSNSNNIHGALTLAGFTPGPGGAIADLLDTFVYLLEGDIGGAIGAGIAIFASGLGLAYKTVKAVGKADKVSDTAKLVKNTVNALSESGSFMKAASNGADAAQTLKAVKQGRVVYKLKDAKTAIKNKFNAKNISKLDLDDGARAITEGTTRGGSMLMNLQFFGGSGKQSKGTLIKGTSIYGDRSYYSEGKLIIEGVDPSTLKVGEQQMLDPRRLDWQRELIKNNIKRKTVIKVTKEGIIEDGHHGARAAAEVGKYVDVEVVSRTISSTNTPILKTPIKGSINVINFIKGIFG